MSKGEHNGNLFDSEVEALVQLIHRYQDELCSSRIHSSYFSLTTVQEELLEHEQLNPQDWQDSIEPKEVPHFARANGDVCTFEQVTLPSVEWEWISDWKYDVNSSTDLNGWTYASSWSHLITLQSFNTQRTITDRVRRRRWFRERKFIGSPYVVATIQRQLDLEKRLSVLEAKNARLSDQLRHINAAHRESQDKIREYERIILNLQRASKSKKNYPMISITPCTPHFSDTTNSVLHESENLLRMISSDDLIDSMSALTRVAHRRRTEMVLACQNELNDTVDEFRDHTLTDSTFTT